MTVTRMRPFLVERLKGFLARPAGSRWPFSVTAGCVLLVCLIGCLDYATGTEARVFPLYYLPIAAGALLVSRAVGLGLAVFSSVFWVLSMYWGGSTWSAGMFTFNAATQMASFGVIALLVGSLARRFEVERDLSRTDPLTSLPNGRSFHETATVLIAGARRSGRPFTVAYLDLDNFKTVNDTRGHLQGDQALKAVAEVLRRATRASDVTARFGGDEFALLLPDTGPEPARTVLERLLAMIADAMRQREWPITVSIGAVSFPKAPATVEAAVHAADSLMYRVKQGGKNRALVEVAGEADPKVAAEGR
jgi:diguanylate cyclase (GGDEF)-like protein